MFKEVTETKHFVNIIIQPQKSPENMLNLVSVKKQHEGNCQRKPSVKGLRLKNDKIYFLVV